MELPITKNTRVNSLEVDSDQAEDGRTQSKKSESKKEMKCDRSDSKKER